MQYDGFVDLVVGDLDCYARDRRFDSYPENVW